MNSFEIPVKQIQNAEVQIIVPKSIIITPEIDYESKTFTVRFHTKCECEFDTAVYGDRQISIIGSVITPMPLSMLNDMRNEDMSWNVPVVNAVLLSFNYEVSI